MADERGSIWQSRSKLFVIYLHSGLVEFEKYWKAIEKIEKWIPGHEVPIDSCYVTGIHMKRGVIQEYRICKNRMNSWISKQEAITLAQEWRIHAILVHCSNGTIYLRPEYKGKRFHDLVC